jgi:hypothetical protein
MLLDKMDTCYHTSKGRVRSSADKEDAISSRSKLIVIGSVIMLAALIPAIAYMVLAPKDMASRILGFLLAAPSLLCFGALAQELWKETEWWYQLQFRRWGRGFNRAIRGGLAVFGSAMFIEAITVLDGNTLSWLLSPLWLGSLLWALLWLGVLVWGWRSAPRTG